MWSLSRRLNRPLGTVGPAVWPALREKALSGAGVCVFERKYGWYRGSEMFTSVP